MDNPILVKTYKEPVYNRKEILRYMGAKEGVSELEAQLDECSREVNGILIYKVCYRTFLVECKNGIVDFGFSKVNSYDLEKNLKGCSKAIIFGATTGIGIDRLITKYTHISPVKALIFQALGAERIEALCDCFCDDVKADNFTKPRFSPGYGDLELGFQKEIFKVLDLPRQIGLTLNDSLIMTPSKSVTAIMGISDMPCKDNKSGCVICENKDCEFRRVL